MTFGIDVFTFGTEGFLTEFAADAQPGQITETIGDYSFTVDKSANGDYTGCGPMKNGDMAGWGVCSLLEWDDTKDDPEEVIRETLRDWIMQGQSQDADLAAYNALSIDDVGDWTVIKTSGSTKTVTIEEGTATAGSQNQYNTTYLRGKGTAPTILKDSSEKWDSAWYDTSLPSICDLSDSQKQGFDDGNEVWFSWDTKNRQASWGNDYVIPTMNYSLDDLTYAEQKAWVIQNAEHIMGRLMNKMMNPDWNNPPVCECTENAIIIKECPAGVCADDALYLLFYPVMGSKTTTASEDIALVEQYWDKIGTTAPNHINGMEIPGERWVKWRLVNGTYEDAVTEAKTMQGWTSCYTRSRIPFFRTITDDTIIDIIEDDEDESDIPAGDDETEDDDSEIPAGDDGIITTSGEATPATEEEEEGEESPISPLVLGLLGVVLVGGFIITRPKKTG